MTRGRGALLFAIVAVSTAAPLVKLAPDAHPLPLALWRLLLAGVVLAIVTRPPGVRRLAAWGPGALAGALLALHFGAWFWSLRLTSIASSVTLVTTAPLFAAALAPRFLGERTPPRLWIGAVVALAGVALLTSSDRGASAGPQPLLGDALALVAALAGSLYLIIGRAVRERVDVSSQIVMTCLGGAAALFLACLAFGVSPLLPTWREAGIALALALAPHLLGHGLLNVAVRRRPAQEVQLALLGEPVLASLIAFAAWGEAPHPAYYPSAALILGGLAFGLARAARLPSDEAHA